MKTLSAFLLYTFLLTGFAARTQHAHVQHEVNKLDREVELLLDTAAKHMVNFILTQNEPEYHLAQEKISRAEELNAKLASLASEEKGLGGKIEKQILEDRQEELTSYKDATIKTKVMSEKPADRKLKVKFKGNSYKLTSSSKKLFEIFHSYLPQN